MFFSRSWVIGRGVTTPWSDERDRRGLGRADPDRQVPLALALLEQHDGLVRGELDPHACEFHLDHGGIGRAYPRRRSPSNAHAVVGAVADRRRGGTGAARPGRRRSAAMSCTARMSGRFRYRSSEVQAVARPRTVGAVEAPRTGRRRGAMRRTDLSSSVHTSMRRGPRARATETGSSSVSPVSTMSSTRMTSRPPMSDLDVLQDADAARATRRRPP